MHDRWLAWNKVIYDWVISKNIFTFYQIVDVYYPKNISSPKKTAGFHEKNILLL